MTRTKARKINLLLKVALCAAFGTAPPRSALAWPQNPPPTPDPCHGAQTNSVHNNPCNTGGNQNVNTQGNNNTFNNNHCFGPGDPGCCSIPNHPYCPWNQHNPTPTPRPTPTPTPRLTPTPTPRPTPTATPWRTATPTPHPTVQVTPTPTPGNNHTTNTFNPNPTVTPEPTIEPTPTPETPTPTPDNGTPAPTPFPLSECLDPSGAQKTYVQLTFNKANENPLKKPHCMARWLYGCYGEFSECEYITPMPLQYGCGGVRARLGVPADGETVALFDSPLSSGGARRRPGLVSLED